MGHRHTHDNDDDDGGWVDTDNDPAFDTFAVVAFYPDGTSQHLVRFVSQQKASRVFVGAIRLASEAHARQPSKPDEEVRRIVVTYDDGNSLSAEWTAGVGQTYPTPTPGTSVDQ